jgi:hypothetical protein
MKLYIVYVYVCTSLGDSIIVSNKAPANRSIWLFGVGWIRFDAIILYDGDKERV